MGTRLRRFIEREAWLFVGVVTLPIGSLFGAIGLEVLAITVFLLGWFLLCPILLFWGEEVAELVLDEEAQDTAQPDPIEELKAQYARGEIDDGEFERRLAVLLDVDELILEKGTPEIVSERESG